MTVMTPKTILLKPKRSEYSAVDAANKSMTAEEMIALLKKVPADTRIMVADINEYLYSPVTPKDFHMYSPVTPKDFPLKSFDGDEE